MDRDVQKEREASRKEMTQRGLLRLMLKLPSVRGKIQLLASHSRPFQELCEAYGEAASTLDKLEKGQLVEHDGMLAEYRATCAEIEVEVIEFCLDDRDSVPK